MTKSTRYETENRNARLDAVASTVQGKITRPWWGTMTELVELLDVQLPFPQTLTPRSLSATLTTLQEQGWLDHTVRHWRAQGRRMVALLPGGWEWDDTARCWVVDGAAVPAQEPSQAVSQ